MKYIKTINAPYYKDSKFQGNDDVEIFENEYSEFLYHILEDGYTSNRLEVQQAMREQTIYKNAVVVNDLISKLVSTGTPPEDAKNEATAKVMTAFADALKERELNKCRNSNQK